MKFSAIVIVAVSFSLIGMIGLLAGHQAAGSWLIGAAIALVFMS